MKHPSAIYSLIHQRKKGGQEVWLWGWRDLMREREREWKNQSPPFPPPPFSFVTQGFLAAAEWTKARRGNNNGNKGRNGNDDAPFVRSRAMKKRFSLSLASYRPFPFDMDAARHAPPLTAASAVYT